MLGPTAGSNVGPTKPDAFKARSGWAQFGPKDFGPLAGPTHEGSSNGGLAAPSSSQLPRPGSSANKIMPKVHPQVSSKLKGSLVSARCKARSWPPRLEEASSTPKRNLEGGGSSEANQDTFRSKSLSSKSDLSPGSETSKVFIGETERDEGISQCKLVNKVRPPFLALSEQDLPLVGAFEPKFLPEPSVSLVHPSHC